MCSAVARPSLTQIRISHSDSSRPLDWQLVILLAMLYVSTITPYEVTVMDSTPLWLRVLNYGFDFIFFIDMSLQFFQGYHDADLKQMVYDPYLICRQYVSTWFVIDFLSIFPFDDVLKVVSGDRGKGTDGTQFLRLVKLARLVKLVKLTRLARIVKTSRSQYTNLIKFGVTIMFLLHWVACAWCLLGQLQKDAEAGNWIDEISPEMKDAELYMFGLEFAIFSMVLGFGRSTPQTFAEQFIAVLVLGVMGTIYAYLLGTICGILSNLDPVGNEIRNIKDLMKGYAHDNHFPPELGSSLIDYLEECSVVLRQQHYDQYLSHLSPALRSRISEHNYGSWIHAVPFFSCDDKIESRNFVMAVAETLVLKVFEKSEVIVSAGENAENMFIIAKGVVAQSAGLVLCNGRFFGEEMLLRRGRYSQTCNAVTFVTVNVLKKEDLFVALKTGRFPRTWKSIRKWIVKRAFIRAIRALVHLRQIAPGHKKMTREEFQRQRDKYISIGREEKKKKKKANQSLILVSARKHAEAREIEAESQAVSASELAEALQSIENKSGASEADQDLMALTLNEDKVDEEKSIEERLTHAHEEVEAAKAAMLEREREVRDARVALQFAQAHIGRLEDALEYSNKLLTQKEVSLPAQPLPKKPLLLQRAFVAAEAAGAVAPSDTELEA